MAIGTPVSLGHGTTAAGTLVATAAMTTTSAVAAGDSIIAVFAVSNNSVTFTSVTDTAGNVYTLDVSRTHATVSLEIFIASCHNALALASGSTITGRVSANTTGVKTITAMRVSGLLTASVLDRTASAEAATAAWSSGATAATTTADELAVGASFLLSTPRSSTPDAPWIELDDYTTGATANDRTLTDVYRVLSATAAVTASGTWTVASNWVAVVATYKGTAAPPAATVRFMVTP